jgi:hypothetical protein
MISLNIDDLAVSSFSTGDSDGGVDDGTDMLKDTDPRACPYTEGWGCTTRYTCHTDVKPCETGGGYNC